MPANPKQALRNAAFVQKSAERNYRNGGELTWSDLPADLLVVIDEAHNYKNLFGMPSQGWGQSFIMAGSASESKRARDLQIKLDLVRQRGGKTLGLTATLVSNSVAEIYNMLRVFAPQALAKRGITNTQHVIDHFCIIEPILSVSLGGQAREGHTIVGFKNLDILRAIWRETTRTYTAADVGLKIPERVEIRELIPPTPEISAYMDAWKDCLEDLIDRGPKALSDDSEEPTLFEIISLLDKVAAHPPLVGIEGEHPKLDRLAANVQKIYRSPRHPGQQIVFADMKAVQNGIQARLVQDGIPADEIVVVNADTAPEPDQRLAIQDRFNRGAFRIIIGGKVISEGIDLQANTHCAHFVNLAWEGATLKQRIGRLVRQGNANAKVGIYYYILEQSTDVYRFLTIQRKTHWSEDLRASQTDTVNRGVFSEDIDEDFLVALARDKAAIRAKLQTQRRDRELLSQVLTTEKTLKLMCGFARPDQRTASREILRAYETKLRALAWIPASLIDEGVRRVQQLVGLQYKRFEARRAALGREPNWEQALQNIHPIQADKDASHHVAAIFLIQITDGKKLDFAEKIQDILDPSLLAQLSDIAPTFGENIVENVGEAEKPNGAQILRFDQPKKSLPVSKPVAVEPRDIEPALFPKKLKASLARFEASLKKPGLATEVQPAQNTHAEHQPAPVRTINHRNFNKLMRVIPTLETIKDHAKLTAEPFMDLHVDILNRAASTARIALAHNFEQNSDLVPDPDMEIEVDFQAKIVIARTYQDAFGYQTRKNNRLDIFLGQWLNNLINQGHRLPPEAARQRASTQDPIQALQQVMPLDTPSQVSDWSVPELPDAGQGVQLSLFPTE